MKIHWSLFPLGCVCVWQGELILAVYATVSWLSPFLAALDVVCCLCSKSCLMLMLCGFRIWKGAVSCAYGPGCRLDRASLKRGSGCCSASGNHELKWWAPSSICPQECGVESSVHTEWSVAVYGLYLNNSKASVYDWNGHVTRVYREMWA